MTVNECVLGIVILVIGGVILAGILDYFSGHGNYLG